MNRHKVPAQSSAVSSTLLGEVRALIEAARGRAALAVNAELTMLFWRDCRDTGKWPAPSIGACGRCLRWLDKHEREPWEASPPGIILCTGKKSEQIELRAGAWSAGQALQPPPPGSY